MKKAMGEMFTKSLSDLIRGMRSHKKDEAEFVQKSIEDIRLELRSTTRAIKAGAVEKLAYLHMFGYDMSWAAFNVIEVMSHPKFVHKRVAYLAASLSYQPDTDVITLATNLIRKDMTSADPHVAGLALSCLADICTPDLARDLAPDVAALLNTSRPYVRKKAVLVLYPVFQQFPDALRPTFPRLKEKLKDDNAATVAGAVNVICELARKNPQNYLRLAPTLFNILTTSSNNWMLIKIVKLFAALCPLERRLAKKLVDPLTNLINTTPAMSLLYECINTCTIGLIKHVGIIKLCISKLRLFVEDADQNLKYLGLLALYNIMKVHPKAVQEHRELVLWCLEDEDVSIRLRALDLLTGMVSKRNLESVVSKLAVHAEGAEGVYKNQLIEKVILLCCQKNYKYVADFEWYMDVLVRLTRIPGNKHGKLIADQFMDIAVRVAVVRSMAVDHMVDLVLDERFYTDVDPGLQKVLYAAAWIVGEFNQHVDDPVAVVRAFVDPRAVVLPDQVQAVFMQNVLKLFGRLALASPAAAAAATTTSSLLEGFGDAPATNAQPNEAPVGEAAQDLADALDAIRTNLPLFTQSQASEVQERACFVDQVLTLYAELGGTMAAEIASVFTSQPLNPVAPVAQASVPLPPDLDLDQQINDVPDQDSDDGEDDVSFWRNLTSEGGDSSAGGESYHDVVYSPGGGAAKMPGFGSDTSHAPASPGTRSAYMLSGPMDEPMLHVGSPETLTGIGPRLVVHPTSAASSSRHKKKGKKKRAKKVRAGDILTNFAMPANATPVADPQADAKKRKKKAAAAAGGAPGDALDLTSDLTPAEMALLQHPTHRVAPVTPVADDAGAKPKKERKKSRKKKERKHSSRSSANAEGTLIDFGGGGGGGSGGGSQTTPAKESSSHHRHHGKKSSSSSSRSKKSRKKKKSSSSSSASASSASKHTAAAGGASASPSGTTLPTPANMALAQIKPLAQDTVLQVAYRLVASAAEPKRICVALTLYNRGAQAVTKVSASVPKTMNVSLANPELQVSVGPQQQAVAQLVLACKAINVHQTIIGHLAYTVGGASAKQLQFQFALPCSAFVLPEAQTTEGVMTLLHSLPPSALQSSSSRIPYTGNPKEGLAKVSEVLRCDLVEANPKGAMLYGRSIQQHHVLAMVKPVSQGLSVEVKTTDTMLSKALIQEVVEAFQLLNA